ncbi:hypothetical protein NSPZN2_60046 [Nitrospira defluvii]|uniref:Transposase n=1 Tax=Nitrospira defluvii TaxID=330214 RepID=A0ABN7MBN2_9BACT|nr:hypothetical protein NSPZN2_60046 [Nitrospira defluvii]
MWGQVASEAVRTVNMNRFNHWESAHEWRLQPETIQP